MFEEILFLKWPEPNFPFDYLSIFLFISSNGTYLQTFNVTGNKSSIGISNLDSSLE